MRGFKYSEQTRENCGILEKQSLRKGGRLSEVVATGGSTVLLHSFGIKTQTSLTILADIFSNY